MGIAGRAIAELAHNASEDPSALLDQARDELDRLARTSWAEANPETLDAFILGADDTYDWVIPDILDRCERLILTAPEAGGKSTLMRQLAVMTSVGLHPFSLEPIPPRMARRRLRPERDRAQRYAQEAYDPGNCMVWSVQEGIDISAPVDRSRLLSVIEQAQPDLMCIGPLYKMHGGDPEKEKTHREIAFFLDEVRTRFQCAIVTEAHSPHGESAGKRSLRPIWSSLWLRWTDFGIGLRPTDDSGEVVDLESWKIREKRAYPRRMRWGTEWSWETDEESVGYVRDDGGSSSGSSAPRRAAEVNDF